MQWSVKRIQQSRKAKRALNSLLWSKYILVNTKKQIFYTVVESILSYSWEIWKQDYKLEKKHLSTEMDICWRAVRTSRLLKVRKEVIREKMRITLIILERLDNSMLKWYGYKVCFKDNGWPKQKWPGHQKEDDDEDNPKKSGKRELRGL